MSYLFDYRGNKYPEWVKNGNAKAFIEPAALQLCKGEGLDIGAGKWPLKGAIPIDNGEFNANNLPHGRFDYIFSSHCLEHLPNPIQSLELWKGHLKNNGILFLYLPHPKMEYWKPQFNRKHFHTWRPKDMAKILEDIGFSDVIHSKRDLYYSFSVVGINKI